MSRDSNGAHSLPAGNPVSSGTAISSTVHNATTADLSAEITDSLSRTGKGGMTAPLKGVDGSAAAPAVSFTSEPSTGLYRAGANNPAISVAGTKRLECTSAGVAVTGTLAVSGATALAALATTGDVAVATNKFTVAAASGNTAVAGTLGVTGVATFSAGLSTHASIPPPVSGDAVVVRTSLPTTGLVQLGNSDTRYLAYDGTNYVMPGAGLINPAAFVVAVYADQDGSILAQTGSVTATVSKVGTGVYRVNVPGITANAIVVASSQGTRVAYVTQTASGYVTVETADLAGTPVDATINVIVAKL
jgi:hypothetical protein